MRLLQINRHGSFSLTDFAGIEIPSYAILSHTWGVDGDEVTFQDLKNVTDRSKAGYKKLRFCAKQAANDGLQYFWVDTCCINKSDTVELQFAINSMFRWYQNAAKCYVYLSDVHTPHPDHLSQASWDACFRKSRWFTRGWTLQELIAPAIVEFFSADGKQLGDKKSLEQHIHEITEIPISALQGTPLSHFTIDERMSWVQNRQTRYEEDKVYSLQGMFDIHIPLIYGEGWKRALTRFEREIKESLEAPLIISNSGTSEVLTLHNNSNVPGRVPKLAEPEPMLLVEDVSDKNRKGLRAWLNPPDPTSNFQRFMAQWRQKSTCQWVLNTSEYLDWKASPNSFLWLYGIPGCGKSMLASVIIQSLNPILNPSDALVYFYIDFNDPEKRTAGNPISLQRMYEECFSGQTQPDASKLFSVLRDMLLGFDNIFIIVDALDECESLAEVLDMLEQIVAWKIPGLHLLVTSRELREITACFDGSVRLYIAASEVDRDIRAHVLNVLKTDRECRKWPLEVQQHVEERLMERCAGMFQWVFCQLGILRRCNNKSSLDKALANLPLTLEETYNRILDGIPNMYKEETITTLQWLVYSFRPMTVQELAKALTINLKVRPPKYDPDKKLWTSEHLLDYCSSLVRQEDDGDVRVVSFSHQSVREYLLSSTGSQGPRSDLQFDTILCHKVIAECCLAYLLRPEEGREAKTFYVRRCLEHYAAENFWKHARLAEEKGFIVDLALAVFSSQWSWTILVNANESHFLSSIMDLHQHHNKSFKAGAESRNFTLPLRYASVTGLVRVTEKLLHEWPNIDRHDRRWSIALVKSSKLGFYDIVKLLVEAGCDYNAKLPPQDIDAGFPQIGTAIEFAAYGGHAQIVKFLLQHQPELSNGHGTWGGALEAASAGGCENVVNIILDAYTEKALQIPPYENALLAAASAPHTTDTREALKLLVGAASRQTSKNTVIESPEILKRAVMFGDGRRVRTLCELGADFNATYGGGQSLLHLAAGRSEISCYDPPATSVTRTLIQLGLGVDTEDYDGETPLHKSCTTETNISRVLLQHGASVHHENKKGKSPLAIVDGYVKSSSVDWDSVPRDNPVWLYYTIIHEDTCDIEAKLRVLQEYA
ncbi:hypothetical protein B0O99DRAFT_695912 [Bisporella sp. PMI_857]|nr:hypothetical protein B0O99DRAFT_695912 [Bisporella sp. PMI_857]